MTYGLNLTPKSNTSFKNPQILQNRAKSPFSMYQQRSTPIGYLQNPQNSLKYQQPSVTYDIQQMEAREEEFYDPLNKLLKKSHGIRKAPVVGYQCEHPGCLRSYTTYARLQKHQQEHYAKQVEEYQKLLTTLVANQINKEHNSPKTMNYSPQQDAISNNRVPTLQIKQ
eukprot:TRINITY_DN669_c0_g1_i1.p1 TRINITY_DN669_c0_g1~~TRINITY_DN669_c0_g1_i1.p1  ORF type:complete len:168 (-),score=2.12 TRINITY_DN669_c0_g1_i1:21-524(-)